jgi:hypothetical protein
MRIYDETAACLVRAALNDSGKPAFREWVCESSREKQPEWPAGWDTASVERGWLLAMAGSARAEEKESPVLPAGLTLERYDSIIARVKTPGHSLGLLSREKGGSGQVSLIAGLLTVLRQSANPAALPLIDRSISFCRDLGHLSKRKIEAEEQSLRTLREDIVKRSRGIGSFLDWYEASKLPVRSGLFDNLPEGMRMKGKKGPVGDRLDAVESRGW